MNEVIRLCMLFFLIIVSYFIDEVVSLTLRNRFVRVPLVASTSELSKLATKRAATRVEEASEQSVYLFDGRIDYNLSSPLRMGRKQIFRLTSSRTMRIRWLTCTLPSDSTRCSASLSFHRAVYPEPREARC